MNDKRQIPDMTMNNSNTDNDDLVSLPFYQDDLDEYYSNKT